MIALLSPLPLTPPRRSLAASFRAAIWVVVTLTLAACGGGGSGVGAEPAVPLAGGGSFSMAVGPADVDLGQGQDVPVRVSITRDGGFSGPVTVSLEQAAAGLTAADLVVAEGTGSAWLTVAASGDLAPGTVVKLGFVATAGGVIARASNSVTIVRPQAYAQTKIAAALAAGSIDVGTSYLYRAYALFDDDRLPDAFAGAGSLREDNELFVEIRQRLPSLPAAVQDQLRPFLVRPADPLSIFGTRSVAAAKSAGDSPKIALRQAGDVCPSSWTSKRSAAYPVRVWAPCVGSAAADAESAVLIDKTLAVLDKIYGPMTALMTEPPPDKDGVDAAIDFYIVNFDSNIHRRVNTLNPGGAITHSDYAEVADGNRASAYVAIDRAKLYSILFKGILIHEFFHVLQFGHNDAFSVRQVAGGPPGASERHWFTEASAQWAEAHFDRTIAGLDGPRIAYYDVHRLFAQQFLLDHEPLNQPGGDVHAYSAYIWPFFVEQEKGNADFMGQIWLALRGTETFADADRIINDAFPFDLNFKRFALRNLNTEFLPGDPLPKAKRYIGLDPDQFKDDLVPPPFLAGNLRADQDYSQDVTLKNLTATYLDLHVDLAGKPVSKIVFDSSGLEPADALDIQALVLTQGVWVTQPITMTGGNITFCFDEGPTTTSLYGSFTRMLLVVSNHSMQSGTDIAGTLKVKPSSTPCTTGWEGTVESTSQLDTTYTGGSTRSVFATAAQLTLELDKASPDLRNVYRLRSGSFSHRDTFTNKGGRDCRTIATAAGVLHPELSPQDATNGATSGILYTFVSPADPLPQYVLDTFSAKAVVTRITNCNSSGQDETTSGQTSVGLWSNPPKPRDIVAAGTVIEGSTQSTETAANSTLTSTTKWRFTKKSL